MSRAKQQARIEAHVARNPHMGEYERKRDIYTSSGMSAFQAQQAASMDVMLGMLTAPKRPARILPREETTRKERREDRDAIIERDGKDCWFCGEFMRPSERTIEHLDPLCRGGSDDLENKVLCHLDCNRHLGVLSRLEKEILRDSRRAA